MSAPDRHVRSRTRAGRLDALDAWLVHQHRALLEDAELVVDVGFGHSPVTVEAWATSVHAVRPTVRVLGLERDPGLVPPTSPPGCELRVGDFEALAALRGASVVRAMNVLRGYRADELDAIHQALGAPLLEGGLVLEGSCDVEGHVTTAHLFRRTADGLRHEALLLHTDLTRGFSPWLFRDFLPRDLRRAVRVGTPIHAALSRWSEVVEAAGATTAAQRFAAGVSAELPWLEATAWERAHGYARLRLERVAP